MFATKDLSIFFTFTLLNPDPMIYWIFLVILIYNYKTRSCNTDVNLPKHEPLTEAQQFAPLSLWAFFSFPSICSNPPPAMRSLSLLRVCTHMYTPPTDLTWPCNPAGVCVCSTGRLQELCFRAETDTCTVAVWQVVFFLPVFLNKPLSAALKLLFVPDEQSAYLFFSWSKQ